MNQDEVPLAAVAPGATTGHGLHGDILRECADMSSLSLSPRGITRSGGIAARVLCDSSSFDLHPTRLHTPCPTPLHSHSQTPPVTQVRRSPSAPPPPPLLAPPRVHHQTSHRVDAVLDTEHLTTTNLSCCSAVRTHGMLIDLDPTGEPAGSPCGGEHRTWS